MITTTLVLLFTAVLAGCGGSKLTTTGYLSDYSKLSAQSDTSLIYVNESALKNYSKFIVDPVQIHFHSHAKGKEFESEELATLKQYMYHAVLKALSGKVTFSPGPGVARLRIALTDIKKSTVVLNILPPAKLTGVGLGSASMEAELLDSVSGNQIAAIVESQKGKRLSLDGLSKFGDAKGVMDDWAQRLAKRVN